jgi:hypothetical protein
MEPGEHIEQLLALQGQSTSIGQKEWKDQLIFYINHLLLTDFSRLLQILYKVDVDEQRLKVLLTKDPGIDSAVLIADMLLERQEEKNKIKASFKSNEDIPDEDKW